MEPAIFVFFILVFTIVGVVFLFIHLLMGSFIRPRIPETEKLTIYECGEPTVGSAWVQFDLRYYVVALLFVIFDVEVAFFFPWATVFGKANQLARIEDPAIITQQEKDQRLAELERSCADLEKATDQPPKQKEESLSRLEAQRAALARLQVVSFQEKAKQLAEIEMERSRLSAQLLPSGLSKATKATMKLATYTRIDRKGVSEEIERASPITAAAASSWAQIAFWDIAIFFGVLMVGFAYVWRRGDIDWVRAYAPHQEPAQQPQAQG